MNWEEAWYYFNVFNQRRELCKHYFPSWQLDCQGYGWPSARWDCGDSWECFYEINGSPGKKNEGG